MDPSIVERTKDTLGKIISRPPMTEKLLSRPPFKYLHDIFSAVMTKTGFYNGLFTPHELDVKNLQDKESKVAYLQKAIDVLVFTTGQAVSVKPAKIIAGQDAEKTNDFLQRLGTAILEKMDSSEGVRKVLNGERPSDSKKRSSDKPSDAAGESSKGRPKTVRSSRKTKDGAEAGSSEQQPDDSSTTTKHSKSKRGAEGTGSPKTSKAKVKGGSKSKDESSKSKKEGDLKSKSGTETKADEEQPSKPKKRKDKREKDKDDDGTASVSKESKKKASKDDHKASKDDHKDDLQGEDSGLLARPVHKPRKKKQASREPEAPQKVTEDQFGGRTSDPEHEADKNQDLDRPTSAKGTRKRTKKRKVESPGGSPIPPAEESESKVMDIGNSGVLMGAVDLPSTVIMDTPGREEEDEGAMDDDNMFVVEDSTPLTAPDKGFDGDRNITDKPEGALTKNIVAMKEHLEGDLDKDAIPTSAMPAISEAQRHKEREIVTKEIDKLQGTIQVLCKSANPLGKIMDYVQEDMDSMQKELEMWQAENLKHTQSLNEEQIATQQELQPLRTMLQELDAKIKEQEEMIGAVKANILKNDVKTQQMLSTLTFGSQ